MAIGANAGRFDAIVFDLDGTLIDSAPGILACFKSVLEQHRIEARLPLDSALIGPPLAETLVRLSGLSSPAELQPLIDTFKHRYDSESLFATPAYPSVDFLLTELRQAGLRLHIATNKRLNPSLAILEHLGLRPHFASIYALDMREPRLADKATMIGLVLGEQGIDRHRVAYVGDKEEDGLAADANGLQFFAAAWGYGEFAPATTPAHWRVAATPGELLAMILSPD